MSKSETKATKLDNFFRDDFERGKNSVKKTVDEQSLRLNLKNLGFKIIKNTQNPSHIPWNLKLNSRATLNYKTDLVIAKK